jgi:hypothetical protein
MQLVDYPTPGKPITAVSFPHTPSMVHSKIEGIPMLDALVFANHVHQTKIVWTNNCMRRTETCWTAFHTSATLPPISLISTSTHLSEQGCPSMYFSSLRGAADPVSQPADRSVPIQLIDPHTLVINPISLSIYGDPSIKIDDLKDSIRKHGILVPLVVSAASNCATWEILSGHRRWASALALGLAQVPCEVRTVRSDSDRRQVILEYNRQRQKSFTQLMREADILEEFLTQPAEDRRLANLRKHSRQAYLSNRGAVNSECRNSDSRSRLPLELQVRAQNATCQGQTKGRTDTQIAQQLGLGGKDLYRQARTIWRMACRHDPRASSCVAQLDAGTKTIHAAYKDLRRRDSFITEFRPTPYDVWSFRHNRAFGIPHPGSIPAAIIAHTLHYFTAPGALVVDPMAGGGTVLDVCQAMGRRCLAYDLEPSRRDIARHDIRTGFPPGVVGADLVFCDPPYYTMLACAYPVDSVASASLHEWITFLHQLARHALATLRPGAYLALLLASQTEKDLPLGHGYLDHVFIGYIAAMRAGFLPERRISCPMDAGYLPQQVRQARIEGRMLGQVRDLLILRKPLRPGESCSNLKSFLQDVTGGGHRSRSSLENMGGL